MKGFKDFLMRGNLIELAVAFIMGGAFAAVVSSFTKVIMDIIGLIFNVKSFSSVAVGGINLGEFLTAAVSFFLTALVVYFLIVVPYKKFRDRKKTEEPPAEGATSEELLAEIRDLLASRQQ